MSKIIFSEEGWNDYIYWQVYNKKLLKKTNELLKDICRNGPLNGIGKPEALKGNFAGAFSRRIDDGNRLIYEIDSNGDLVVLSCKGHYNDK